MPRALSQVVQPIGMPGLAIEVFAFGQTSPAHLRENVFLHHLLSPGASIEAKLTPDEADQLAAHLAAAAAIARSAQLQAMPAFITARTE